MTFIATTTPRRASSATRRLAREAGTIAAGLAAATTLLAATVRAGWAAEARDTLRFGFAGVPATAESALSILAANGRLLVAILAAVLVAQAPWLAGAPSRPGPILRVLRGAIDVLLTLAVAANVALVGVALGAYGTRMLAALLPHGPLEVGAFATALALYRDASRGPLPPRRILSVAGGCLLALAAAALLETFIVP